MVNRNGRRERPMCVAVCHVCGHLYHARVDGAIRFCSHACAVLSLGTPAQRFARKWRVSPSGCHVWIAGGRGAGYGAFYWRGRMRNAHRVAWELAHGPVPRGRNVLHHCDNRACVNPAHLYLGTHTDNTADMVSRGRARGKPMYGDDNPSRTRPERVPRGTRNGNAKLTAEQVRAMRRRYAFRSVTYRQLAAEYGLTYAQTWKVVNRRAYAEVGD